MGSTSSLPGISAGFKYGMGSSHLLCSYELFHYKNKLGSNEITPFDIIGIDNDGFAFRLGSLKDFLLNPEVLNNTDCKIREGKVASMNNCIEEKNYIIEISIETIPEYTLFSHTLIFEAIKSSQINIAKLNEFWKKHSDRFKDSLLIADMVHYSDSFKMDFKLDRSNKIWDCNGEKHPFVIRPAELVFKRKELKDIKILSHKHHLSKYILR